MKSIIPIYNIPINLLSIILSISDAESLSPSCTSASILARLLAGISGGGGDCTLARFILGSDFVWVDEEGVDEEGVDGVGVEGRYSESAV